MSRVFRNLNDFITVVRQLWRAGKYIARCLIAQFPIYYRSIHAIVFTNGRPLFLAYMYVIINGLADTRQTSTSITQLILNI